MRATTSRPATRCASSPSPSPPRFAASRRPHRTSLARVRSAARHRAVAPASAIAGVAASLALLAGCGDRAPAARVDPARPPVVLVTLDTTRADRLGCYGYERATSPRLDELARDAVRHARAYSTSSWTLPAHASLFTGAYTYTHGARYDADGPLVLGDAIDHAGAKRYRARGLDPRLPTLAERFAEAGYATGGFVAGPWMKRVFGLDRGFAHWDDDGIDHENGRRADALTDAALAWLGEHADEPFLLFLNYYDAHSPYDPPASVRDRFAADVAGGGALPGPGEPMTLAQANALYDAEIAFADEHLGRLLDALRERGLYDGAWIVVTADHGDVLGEHGKLGHGRYLWEEEIRIPLLVKRPGARGAGSTSDAIAQINDVAPMLVRELGLAPLAGGGGPLARADDAALAELYPLPFLFAKGDWRALVVGRDKLMWNGRGRHALYDLASPEGEDANRADAEVGLRDALLARLDALLATLAPAPALAPADVARSRAVDDATRRALEGLGYLDEGDEGGEGDGRGEGERDREAGRRDGEAHADDAR